MHLPKWIKDTRIKGIFAATALLLVIVLYAAHEHAFQRSAPPTVSFTLPSSLLAGASSATSSTTSKTVATTTAKTIPVHKTTSSASSTAAASNTTSDQLYVSANHFLDALVNIVCVSGDQNIPSISGSGVIIDSRGIIMTAAHVAQLFLLQDYLGPNKVICIVRTGSPARRAYLAEPIYVSPTWIAENPTTLKNASPLGTGENDFALLAITDTATSTPLPTSFPFVPLAQDTLKSQQKVAIGSYGAQYLTAAELNTSLYATLVFGTIQTQYTFGTNTVDLVSILGTEASQEGSSGGGILNANGQLGGIITTSSIAGTFQTRTLNAITLAHIRRSFSADTGQSLDAFLQSESISQLVAGFATESKLLGKFLMTSLGIS